MLKMHFHLSRTLTHFPPLPTICSHYPRSIRAPPIAPFAQLFNFSPTVIPVPLLFDLCIFLPTPTNFIAITLFWKDRHLLPSKGIHLSRSPSYGDSSRSGGIVINQANSIESAISKPGEPGYQSLSKRVKATSPERIRQRGSSSRLDIFAFLSDCTSISMTRSPSSR